jgi:hypothetical protein
MLYQATVSSYQWYSSNSSVASVSYTNFKECKVTGKAEGTCRVYFTANISVNGHPDSYYFYWDVTVSGYTSGGGSSTVVNPTRAVVYPTELTLEVGQTNDMSYEVYPSNATYTVYWQSSNTSIATVSQQGKITAVSLGSTNINLWVLDSQGNCNSIDLIPYCKVTVVQPTRLYDEDDTEAPNVVSNANVTVNRKLNANKWSTICLPFAMSEVQAKNAFGTDVEIADFTGYDTQKDAGGHIVGLSVNFSDVTEMEANHPYIIKVKNDISQFSVDGIDVTPSENPKTIFDNGLSGDQQEIYGSFVGTYVAETIIPQNGLFISDNQFWYSNGNKKMKAFRAYFNFSDVLAETEDQNQLSRIVLSFDNESTGVREITNCSPANNIYYDLQGRRVLSPKKGLYINNGRIIKVK